MLSKEDLKLALRDEILMTSIDKMKKGDTLMKYTSDFFSLERIGKLLVSSSDTVERYLTKEILLKIMKSMLTNNAAIIRRSTGKILALHIHNVHLKQLIF